MFKQKCPKCNEKISKKYDFCPFCGLSLKKEKEKEDYGMLGANDDIEGEMNNMFNSFGGGMLNKMLSGAMKMLEKEMQKEMKNIEKKEIKVPNSNFQLYINGKKVNLNEDFQEKKGFKKEKINQKELPTPSEKIIKNSIKLPREEAKSKLTRISNKVIYEIEAPGIKNMESILIRKLEDSVEIRIFTKNKVLNKNLTVKLPLIKYYLEKERLYLEFQCK